MNHQVNIETEKYIDNNFNKFIYRSINDHKWKIMPPLEFVPKKIDVKYCYEDDILSIDLFMKNKISINSSENIKFENIDDITNEICIFEYKKKNINAIKKEVNEVIKNIDYKNDILNYDINLRIMNLVKAIVLLLATNQNLEKRIVK